MSMLRGIAWGILDYTKMTPQEKRAITKTISKELQAHNLIMCRRSGKLPYSGKYMANYEYPFELLWRKQNGTHGVPMGRKRRFIKSGKYHEVCRAAVEIIDKDKINGDQESIHPPQ